MRRDMSKRVCPWWLGYFLASPLRRLVYDPASILAPYVRSGMTVLEPGPGMGFFTLELARRVGPSGRVVAVDVQPRMIAGLKRRAARAGVAERLDARLAAPDCMNVEDLAGAVDFTLAFAVAHEMSAPGSFFAEVAKASKPGAAVLFAEPAGHVSVGEWEAELHAASQAGFVLTDRPPMRRSLAVVLKKPAA